MPVITGPENIAAYRRMVLLKGLQLEVRTGLKHAKNGVVLGVKSILKQNGIEPARMKAKLLKQYETYLESLKDGGNHAEGQ